MQTVIIVVHLIVVLALIGVVLLQKSEGGGLGIGSTGGFMTSRGTANVLTRATAVLAGVFFLTSLALSVLAGVDRRPSSIINTGAPANGSAPGNQQAPLGSGGGVLDSLRRQSETPGAPPQPPLPPATEPQVPPSR